MTSCYVHIPFCHSICFYCDFCRYVATETQKEEWLHAIVQEANTINDSLHTLYFGGGTPSSLSIAQFQKLSQCFIHRLEQNYEWTIECNPESLTLKKARAYAEAGVNRVSLGVQSFQDTILKKIGRNHTSSDVYTSIQRLKDVGICNISIDLIFGIPGQTMEDLRNDLEQFLNLDIPHISIYSLQIEENSIFGKQGLQPIDEDIEADMYDFICDTLHDAGFEHYEISSFCRKGYASKHNQSYWNDSDYIGIGCGSSGREYGKRYDHVSVLSEYIKHPLQKEWIKETTDDRAFEAIMMSLRTSFGLDIKAWNMKYNKDFMTLYQDVLNKYDSYFEWNQETCRVNELGMKILNTILVDF